MVKKIAVVVFCIVNPTGGAGGDHGQGAAVLNTAEQLSAFLHDGEVSCKVGIKYLLEAETAQSSNHLAGNGSTDLHTELFTESSTNSRSSLNDNILASLHSSVNTVNFGFLHQSAGGTYVDALAAHDAGGVDEASVLSGSNDGVETTVLKAEDTHILAMSVLAACYAAAAEDALGSITDDGRSQFIISDRGLGADKTVFAGAGSRCDIKQFAFAVFYRTAGSADCGWKEEAQQKRDGLRWL